MKTALILSPNDAKRLTALHRKLGEFVAGLNGQSPKPSRIASRRKARSARAAKAEPAPARRRLPVDDAD